MWFDKKKHMWWPEQQTPTEIQILLCGFDRKKISGSKKKSLKLGIIQMNKKCGARPIFGPWKIVVIIFFFDRYFGAHRRPDDWIRNWILQILM